MFALTVLVATLCCVSNAQITITWSDCAASTGAYGKITDVTWTPQNFAPGDTVVITATAAYDKQVTAAHSDIEFLGGLIKNNFNGCTGATIQAPLGLATLVFAPAGCPLNGPSGTFVQTVTTSALFPGGATPTIYHAKDQNMQPFICLDITLNNSG